MGFDSIGKVDMGFLSNFLRHVTYIFFIYFLYIFFLKLIIESIRPTYKSLWGAINSMINSFFFKKKKEKEKKRCRINIQILFLGFLMLFKRSNLIHYIPFYWAVIVMFICYC
jgi:hypothetical protein